MGQVNSKSMRKRILDICKKHPRCADDDKLLIARKESIAGERRLYD